MDALIAETIEKLPTLNKPQLLQIWAENFKTPPPPNLRKDLMVPILAAFRSGNTAAYRTEHGLG